MCRCTGTASSPSRPSVMFMRFPVHIQLTGFIAILGSDPVLVMRPLTFNINLHFEGKVIILGEHKSNQDIPSFALSERFLGTDSGPRSMRRFVQLDVIDATVFRECDFRIEHFPFDHAIRTSHQFDRALIRSPLLEDTRSLSINTIRLQMILLEEVKTRFTSSIPWSHLPHLPAEVVVEFAHSLPL